MRLFLSTLLCLTLFSLNSILCRMALVTYGMDAILYTAIRCFSAVAMLALLCLVHVIRPKGAQSSIWRDVWQESSWPGAFFLFMYMFWFSITYIAMPSAAGTLILNSCVQFSMLGWGLCQGIYLTRQQLVGLIAAFAGLVFLMMPGLSTPPLWSAFTMAIAGLSWGAYTVCGRSASSAALATAGNFMRSAVIMAVVLIVAPLFHTFSLDVPGPALACALAAGALASAFSYILWYLVVPKYSLVAISIIQLAIPIITAVLGAMFLSEAITLRLVICTVVILGGIALAVSAKKHA